MAALLSSSTFYLFFKMVSNCRDLGQKEWSTFPIGELSEMESVALQKLGESIEARLRATAETCIHHYPSGVVEYEEYYPAKAKSIIDQVDHVLANHYGFTDVEMDFIINYDIKYRMGRDTDGEGDGK